MKKQDRLIRLVITLTAAEKKYFQEYALRKSQLDTTYFKLFDLITKDKITSDTELKKKLPKSASNFHKIKAYLYEQILQALSNLKGNEDEKVRRIQALVSQNILMSKGLYEDSILLGEEEAEKALLKLDEENFLTFAYNNIVAHQNLLQFNEAIQVNKKYLIVLDQIKNCNEYKALDLEYWQLKHNQKQIIESKKTETSLKLFMQHPLLQDISKAKSKKAKVIFNEIWADYYGRYTDKMLDAVKVIQDNISIMESSPEANYIYPGKYLSALRNVSCMHTFLKNKKNALTFIEKIKAFTAPSSRLLIYKEAYAFYMELYWCLQFEEHSKATKLISSYKKIMQDVGIDENQMHYNINYNLLAVYLCKYNKYEEAIEYLTELVNSKVVEENFNSYYANYKLMLIICHFMIGNHKVLDSLIRTSKYYLEKKNLLNHADALLIQFFKKWLYNPTKEKDLFIQYIEATDKIKDIAIDKNTLNMIQDINWIDTMKRKLKIQN